MSTTATIAATVLLGMLAIPGCAGPSTGTPVAVRPSVTIYPVHLVGEPRRDVAEVVALLLEKRGMKSIEVDDRNAIAQGLSTNRNYDSRALYDHRFRCAFTKCGNPAGRLGRPGSA